MPMAAPYQPERDDPSLGRGNPARRR